jgi:Nucleotidyltransferase domain
VIPREVSALTAAHLACLDDALPGLVEGLYLGGSVALGDYRPGTSDVDFVAVCSRPLCPRDYDHLASAHALVGAMSATRYDGFYVERSRLAQAPVEGEIVPQSLAGEFRASEPCAQLSPVTWLELRQCGLAVRGVAPEEIVGPVDFGVLRSWLLENLQTYWLGIATLREATVAAAHDEDAFEPGPAMWGTLGPGRLHHTLASGSVISKTEAGRYTADRFPQWADLADRCVRARAGEEVRFTIADARASAALIRRVVSDAVGRWGGRRDR